MNFEKIKKIVIQYQKIIILLVVVAGIMVLVRVNNANSNSFDAQSSSNISLAKKENPNSVSQSSVSQATQSKEVTCDISGAVRHEGVYSLKNGARLQELIEAAGGLKSNAQIKAINRAIMLKDQDKIHIPYKGEKVTSANTINNDNHSSTGNTQNDSQNNNDIVNLNTATAADLQKLSGIGEKKAEQIISYREQKGQFKKIEDLMQVSGIGEKTFAALKDHLSI